MNNLIEQIKEQFEALPIWDRAEVAIELRRPPKEMVHLDVEYTEYGPRLVSVCFMGEAEYASYQRNGGVWGYDPVSLVQEVAGVTPDRKATVAELDQEEIERMIKEVEAAKGFRFGSLTEEKGDSAIGLVECWEDVISGWVEAQFDKAPDCEANRERGYMPLDELHAQLNKLHRAKALAQSIAKKLLPPSPL